MILESNPWSFFVEHTFVFKQEWDILQCPLFIWVIATLNFMPKTGWILSGATGPFIFQEGEGLNAVLRVTSLLLEELLQGGS